MININKFPGDTFTLVLLLLKLQDKSVELVMQRLVTILDAELSEGIERGGFKPKGIQNVDERRVGGGG